MRPGEWNRAVVFTDLVDSTRMALAAGHHDMRRVWMAHDESARAAIRRWRGLEIGRSDGFLVLFDSVEEALGFARDYHRSVEALPRAMKARVGLDFGLVATRENLADDVRQGATPYDADGIALHVAARVMGIAQGGQTLLSGSARQALGDSVSALVHHGHWRLKGLDEPIEIFGEGDVNSPPSDHSKAYRVVRENGSWKAAGSLPHNLPNEAGSFVGRQVALRDLASAFEADARAVTLLGLGGIGKTRLALEYARGWLAHYPGGAWFCDLSVARDLEGMFRAVAQGLSFRLERGDPLDQISEQIARRGECLVILDNFEQITRDGVAALGRWLSQARDARFLVTSREVVGVSGEAVLVMSPLGVEESVDLFIQRAKTANLSLDIGSLEVKAVRQIADGLDGLPLAIELAAARVRTVPMPQLVARLGQRYELLRSAGQRADRQSALMTTLDWSWDLLRIEEREAFAQLSVFEGGFTLEALRAIVICDGRESCVNVVGSLVDKSLVRLLPDGRFALLDSVREYAAIRLRQCEEEEPLKGTRLSSRHVAYFASLSDQAATRYGCADLDNLLKACALAIELGISGSAARCLVNAWAALRLTGPYGTAVKWASRMLELPLSDEDAGLVHWVLGSSLDVQGRVDAAHDHFMKGLARVGRDSRGEARVRLLSGLGSQMTLTGDTAGALELLEDALCLAREGALCGLQVIALNALGRLMDHQAMVSEARRYYEDALTLARQQDDRMMEGGILGNLGGIHLDLGELDLAQQRYEEALQIADQMGDRRWKGNACCNLGLVLIEQNRCDTARDFLDQAIELARSTGNVRLEYTAACNMGILLTRLGQLQTAEDYLRAAVQSASAAGDLRSDGQFRSYLALALARQGRLDEADAAVDAAERALLSLPDRLSLAMVYSHRAEIRWIGGDEPAARQARDLAASAAEALGCGPRSELSRRLQDLDELLRCSDPSPHRR